MRNLPNDQAHRLWLIPMAAVLLSGCTQMGYNLGSMLPPEVKTVHVPTVLNNTEEPTVEIEVTRAVIEALQLDGSLKIASRRDADSVLTIVLTDYRIVPVAFRRTGVSSTTTQEYRIFLTASMVLIRTSDGSVVAESPRVRGDAIFEFQGDLTSSKRVGLPFAADDLSKDIVERVVEYW